MENVSNVTSEEELLKLREEGKISEQEYAELLGTIRRSPGDKSREELPAEPQFQAFRKRIMVGGFVICILGIVVGLILKLPLVWGLGILGIIVVPIKYHLISKRQ
jgi:accessory gene regulator protein AgrB